MHFRLKSSRLEHRLATRGGPAKSIADRDFPSDAKNGQAQKLGAEGGAEEGEKRLIQSHDSQSGLSHKPVQWGAPSGPARPLLLLKTLRKSHFPINVMINLISTVVSSLL